MTAAPSYLILMLTDRCNLNCSYCYLGKQKHSMDSPQGIDMSLDTIDHIFELENIDKNTNHIQITGGEPFLVPHLIKYTAIKAKKYCPEATLAIQTNATLMDEDSLNLIQEFGINIGISLDGEPPLQEAQRGKAAATFQALHLMEKKQIPFNITTVVTSKNIDKLSRLVLMLGAFSMARGIGLDPLVIKGSAINSSICGAEQSRIEKSIGKMTAALDMINNNRRTPLLIREMERIKNRYNASSATAFCHAAIGKSLAVTPQGELFPCSQTAWDYDFFLGTMDTIDTINFSSQLESCRLENALQCKNCSVDLHCPGDCPSRLYYNTNGSREFACTLYQSLMSSINSEMETI